MMDTKKLRQKILDLAIRGKLVPQDPNDEPASVLLQRIREEKERLIKEGKIKRSKTSAANDDIEPPFEIPESWEWVTIEEICSKIGSGSTPKGSNYSQSGIPFFRSQNVYNEGLIYDDIKFISEEVHNSMKGTEVIKNDLLLNITGGSLGRCAIVPDNFERGNVSQHVCILRPIIVLPSFLHAFIISDYFSSTMILSGSGREGLPKYSLEIMSLPLPPLAEQQRIANEIERWFAAIDELESNEADLQKTIDKAKSKILDLAIHGKLVPQDPNDEPAIELLKRINPKFEACENTLYKSEIPQNWCLSCVDKIANIIGGVSYKKDDIQVNGIRILRGGNIQDGKIIIAADDVFVSESYYNVENEVKSGDIVVVASTGSSTVIGKTGYAINVPAHTQIGAFLRIIRPAPLLSSHFINYVFLSDEFKTYIRNIAKGSNINNIKNNHLSEYVIALPPYQEQLRIVAKIEELFAVLDSISAS